MSNQIKLEAGQWYRNRDGQICYCVGKSEAMRDQMEHWLVETENAYSDMFRQDGSFLGDIENKRDIIEHLPDCDSFDWEPQPKAPKYRPFRNAEEFKPHRDKWVKYKQSDAKKTMLCVSFSNEGVTVSVSFMPYRNAFDLLVFEDGTPFGVEVS